MSTNPISPSADQLAAARSRQWHQNGEALLTFENLRSWINVAGLALYGSRPSLLPAPAPSMVEAVLGAPNPTPALAETEQARSLLARLIAEGVGVPLNLFGSPTGVGTETPDFIAAIAVLPYIFTLRGDKNWKQPPATAGATRVSPLALAAYNVLAERSKEAIPGLSVSALVSELGKEVTEAAVLRALTDLWQHLRVLPVPQPNGGPTLWELTSARFTKQIKAGSNAGQPTALSALISLYLGQAIVASEADIEVFLSPLASRSRIRDVIHALVSARQLETIAVEGRTVLHVAGDLPTFLAEPSAITSDIAALSDDTAPSDDIDSIVVTTEDDASSDQADTPQPRIKKFIPAPRKVGTGFVARRGLSARSDLAKPARKPFAPASDRERRPFARSARPDRPERTFSKPWEEEKSARLAAARTPSKVPDTFAAEADSIPTPDFDQPRIESSKPVSPRKPSFGSKPSFDRKPGYGSKPAYGSKPRFSRDSADSRPPRRDFALRSGSESGDFAPRRKTFSKPGTFGRKREGGFSPRPGSDRGDSRPPRREFSSRPPRDKDFDRAERPAESGPRYRKFDAPRSPRPFNPDRPPRPFNPDRPPRSFDRDRPASSRSDSRPAFKSGSKTGFKSDSRPGFKSGFKSTSRPDSRTGSYAKKSGGSYAGKSSEGYQGKSSGFSDKKPYAKSRGGFAAKSGSSYAEKPTRSAGKKPYAKSEGSSARPGKPAGTFDKFKNNAKPFGKRPPARKWKPDRKDS